MIHARYRPQPPLDQLVDYFWVSGAYRAQTSRERVLSTGAQALVIHLGEGPFEVYADDETTKSAHIADALVCGARSSPLVIGTALGPTVGVHFKPGVARPFFDVPADALAQQTVSLELLWGGSVQILREQLAEASCSLERVRILEAFLAERAGRAFEPPLALSEALCAFEEPDLPSVAEVNRRTGPSPKRLLALFRDVVGLSPKGFLAISTFSGRAAGPGERYFGRSGAGERSRLLRPSSFSSRVPGARRVESARVPCRARRRHRPRALFGKNIQDRARAPAA